MADNTLLNSGTGGNTFRDIDRSGVHVQQVGIDIGGASAEKLLVAGQTTMTNSMPVVIASDQTVVAAPALAVSSGTLTNTSSTIAVALPPGTQSVTLNVSSPGGWTGNGQIWLSGDNVRFYAPTAGAFNSPGATDLNKSIPSGGANYAFVQLGTFSGGTPTFRLAASPSLPSDGIAVSVPGGLAVNSGYIQLTAYPPDKVALGNITTQNLNPLTGTATTGSTVVLGPFQSACQVAIGVTGTYTGALSVQLTPDNSTWFTNTQATAVINSATGALGATIPSATPGMYEFNTGGAPYVRVSGLAAITGTAAVTMLAGNATGLVALDAPIPGTSTVAIAAAQTLATVTTVGTVTSVSATTPAVTTTTAATLSSAATTNATSVKASAGNLYSITVSNTGGAAAFFKLFNKASAPTVGTDVPILTIAIPASGTVNVPFGTQGFRMATGIAFAITNLAADSDTTAVAAAQVKAMVAYI